jgi:hypothetical protein
MGDRANVVIRDDYVRDNDREAVFLYSHWGGYELPEVVRRALARRERWDDAPYLARIVFDTMIGGHQGGETGFGISTRIPDNEYDLIVLSGEKVHRVPVSHYRDHGFGGLDACSSVGFVDYITTEPRTWENLTSAERP